MSEDHELSVTTLIAAPPAAVWEAMTDRIEQWWCPLPWRYELVDHEWRAGARSRTVMHGPDGERMESDGLVLLVEPGRRYAMTDAVTGDLMPSGPFMLGIWEIAPEGEGTRYTARARHWTAEAAAQHRDMGFEQGWAACAAQLKSLVETGSITG